MNPSFPSAAEVANKLADLKAPQIQRLAELSGVPFHTLLKIKTGETSNPRLDTVRQFFQHISEAALI
jgi:predicted transcriptional regulator